MCQLSPTHPHSPANVDNLGAVVDLNILYHIVSGDVDFAMEVVSKSRADTTGGTLVSYDGRLKLLESTMIPRDHEQDFKSLKTFSFFNSNSLWVALKPLKVLVARDAITPAVIVSERPAPKEARPSAGSNRVLELETAAGAAIEFFSSAIGIRVPRSRFLPVKSTSDLLLVQSTLYDVRHGSLVPSPLRDGPPPLIKLGPEFAALDAYAARIPSIPDCLYLDHLSVSGDVYFGPGVVLRGTVVVVAEGGGRIDVPAGSVLENCVATGSFRLLEH